MECRRLVRVGKCVSVPWSTAYRRIRNRANQFTRNHSIVAPKNANLGARRVATQGRPLSPDFKRAIVLVKDYFDRTKGDLCEQAGSSAERTATALGVGLATVKRVMADSKRSPVGLIREESIRRGRPPRVLSDSLQTRTREYVRQANCEGSHITLEMLAEYLKAEGGDPNFSVRTLGRSEEHTSE